MRKIVVDRYIIFYLIHEEEHVVTISRILYGKRNWERLL
ncbi:type II toxin-antitoxin system RelE/ParE family toxin [Sporolactobacillus inulinus]